MIPTVRVALEKDITEIRANLSILQRNLSSVSLAVIEVVQQIEELENRFNAAFPEEPMPRYQNHWVVGKDDMRHEV